MRPKPKPTKLIKWWKSKAKQCREIHDRYIKYDRVTAITAQGCAEVYETCIMELELALNET